MVEPENENKARIKDLAETIEKQSAIIMQHQLSMEQVDRQTRETNVILFGVPDEHTVLNGATTEEAEIQRVMSAVEVGPEVVALSHKRLGQRAQGSNRPRLGRQDIRENGEPEE